MEGMPPKEELFRFVILPQPALRECMPRTNFEILFEIERFSFITERDIGYQRHTPTALHQLYELIRQSYAPVSDA